MEQLLSSENGIQMYTGDWQAIQAGHLLKRTLFGATSSDIGYFQRMRMTDAVAEILRPSPAPATTPLDNYSGSWAPWVDADGAINAPDGIAHNISRVNSLQCWWIGQLLNQGRSIHEKMTLFWHNHFSVDASGHFADIGARLWYDQYLTLRQHALGGFRDLLRAMLTDPALLLFHRSPADDAGSFYREDGVAEAEGLAIELLEGYLFGRNPFPGFTRGDVACIARILSGHTVDESGKYVFDPGLHDTGDKRFSSFFGSKVIQGESGEAAPRKLDHLLDMLLGMRSVALFISRKLYRFFVDYRLEEEVELSVIQPMADVFMDSGYEMTAVLGALLRSTHFYELACSGAYVLKSPLDFLIGICREYDLSAQLGGTAAQYQNWSMLLERSQTMEKEILEMPVIDPGLYKEHPAYQPYRQVILTGPINRTREYHSKVS